MKLKYESHLVAPAKRSGNSRKTSGGRAGEVKTPPIVMTKNIKVSDDVHKDLGDLGKLSDSYNDVIRKLIDHYKKTAKVKITSMDATQQQ